MEKTIKYLSSRWYYRFVKVTFVISILIVLLGYNALIISMGTSSIDNSKTEIICTFKDKKVFSPQDIDLTLNSYQFENKKFDYKAFFEGFNDYQIRDILNTCYDRSFGSDTDVFALQRVYEIGKGKTSEELTETEKEYIDSQVKEITAGYKTTLEKARYLDYSVKLFDVKPVFTYSKFIKYFLIGNLIIILFFEIVRRLFYYIVLGEFIPKKDKVNKE